MMSFVQLSIWAFMASSALGFTFPQVQEKCQKTMQQVLQEPIDIRYPWKMTCANPDNCTTWQFSSPSWWTSGFFTGQLLLTALENQRSSNNTDHWSSTVINFVMNDLLTTTQQRQALDNSSHDTGFKMFLPYRLLIEASPTHKNMSVSLLTTAAQTLSSRYCPVAGVVKSWSNPAVYGKDTIPVITDNLMNLELLLWAGAHKVNGDTRQRNYTAMAISHLDKTMKDFDQNGTACMWHLVVYNASNGHLLHKSGKPQGYSKNASIWSRGQAWTIYGYTMAYRYTKNAKYLEFAELALNCYLNKLNASHISDYVPPYDFAVPRGDPTFGYRDTSAASIIASALIELHR